MADQKETVCRTVYETGGHRGAYVADFPDLLLADHPNCIFLPHLGDLDNHCNVAR